MLPRFSLSDINIVIVKRRPYIVLVFTALCGGFGAQAAWILMKKRSSFVVTCVSRFFCVKPYAIRVARGVENVDWCPPGCDGLWSCRRFVEMRNSPASPRLLWRSCLSDRSQRIGSTKCRRWLQSVFPPVFGDPLARRQWSAAGVTSCLIGGMLAGGAPSRALNSRCRRILCIFVLRVIRL